MKFPTVNSSGGEVVPARSPKLLRSEKIGSRHLERLSMVYVRQSNPQQLIRHQESTQVQYSLKLRAQDLGWPESRVVVIDEDLGKSGTSIEGRTGFQRLVTEVSLDHVGIILGVEMSRLARSCKDWYQLLEVCAVFGTLIADLDGVYDPSQYNDRLLLGLKGTMSEAELHIIKQRMSQGRLNKAKRGELLFHMPIGYVQRASGEVTLDPDAQAQEVVRLVFCKFEELGTLNAVLQFLSSNGVKLPVRPHAGMTKGELEWRRPNRMTLQNMLKNPLHAGAYTYGRRATDARRKVAGRPGTGRTVVPPEECMVFLKDRFPGYISWDQFERNQARLKANRSVAEEAGAPKHGPSLLSGLAVCGKCGCRMTVRYQGPVNKHAYVCSRRLTDYGEESCQSLAGPPLDAFVSKQALNALEPASLELSLAAAESIERQRSELENLWDKRLERARYESERAARQYAHVEPENRLVARLIEQEWEEKLQAQKKLEEEHERLLRNQPRLLTEDERAAIRALASNIPALWSSPGTTMIDRKEILRQVIDRVVVDVVGESECVKLVIHWAGGGETQHGMVRPVARLEQLTYWPQLANRIRELTARKLNAESIAEQLNKEGWKPPKRCEQFGIASVRDLLRRLGLTKSEPHSAEAIPLGKDEWPISALAYELGMPPVTLYCWLRRGLVKGSQLKDGKWIIYADCDVMKTLRELRNLPRGHQVRRRWVEKAEAVRTTTTTHTN
ncbi:MAG: recombinase family protein [Nitrospira sp.]